MCRSDYSALEESRQENGIKDDDDCDFDCENDVPLCFLKEDGKLKKVEAVAGYSKKRKNNKLSVSVYRESD